MRRKIIAGNWKMNMTATEAVEFANSIKQEVQNFVQCDILICPPFTALGESSRIISTSNILLGAQDMHWEQSGAYTGEISAAMLKDLGCRYVIIGHSERRKYFGETNETVNKKVKAAIKFGLLPIMCVGESLKEREAGRTFKVIEEHVTKGLLGLSDKEVRKIIIAYEPVWAIGTGKNATPEQAQEAHSFIRGLIAKLYNKKIADGIRIQYGGSVKPDNAHSLLSQPDVDGALVGGASLKVDSFVKIIQASV